MGTHTTNFDFPTVFSFFNLMLYVQKPILIISLQWAVLNMLKRNCLTCQFGNGKSLRHTLIINKFIYLQLVFIIITFTLSAVKQESKFCHLWQYLTRKLKSGRESEDLSFLDLIIESMLSMTICLSSGGQSFPNTAT